MTPLPEKFRQRGGSGFDFVILQRDGDVVLVSKSKPMESCNGTLTVFEVAIVQKLPAYEIAGNRIEAHEAMPGNEQWGVSGWSFLNKGSAIKQFNNLISKKTKP